ncbi:MAG: hypothetical protein JJU33_06020 [Phycisphaerales bacterium]|nr:hypothetical protein [Phycisphaerales bacterium]
MSESNERAGRQDRAQAIREDIRLCLRRVARSDFQREKATDRERELLASSPEPITNELVQDFVAWRRSLLWVAAAFIALYAVLTIASFQTFEQVAASGVSYEDYREQAEAMPEWSREGPVLSRTEWEGRLREQVRENFGEENTDLINGILVVFAFAVVVAAVLTVLAARQWKSVRASRRWSRAAWLVMFGVPFLVSFLPITAMMDFEQISADLQEQEQMRMLLGASFALGVFMTIAPKAIALFPGIIRSCISLKTLVPESATPGWIAALMAPLYAIFLLTLVSVMNQMQGDMLLIGGVLCLMAGPMIYVWKAEDVVRPHTPEETTTVLHGARKQASLLTLAGVVLIGAFIIELPNMTAIDALSFVAGLVGNVLLMTVVAADLIVALLYHSYRQSREFAGTEMEASLDLKYRALSEVGFTALRGRGSGAAASPVLSSGQSGGDGGA